MAVTMAQTMARRNFAPVAPVQILQDLLERDLKAGKRQRFGNYHLFLAHHVTERKEEFTKLIQTYFTPLRSNIYYKPLTIIMDNSLVENGMSVDQQMVSDAVAIIQDAALQIMAPKIEVIPVLPDVMGDGHNTILESSMSYPLWLEDPVFKKWGSQFMVVAQGRSWYDYTSTINYFFTGDREEYHRGGISWVGIPRFLVKTIGSRIEATRYADVVARNASIHLLGFSDNLWDDVQSVRLGGENVRGIDSAVPVRADLPLMLNTSAEQIGARIPDWFENGTLNFHAEANILSARKWVM